MAHSEKLIWGECIIFIEETGTCSVKDKSHCLQASSNKLTMNECRKIKKCFGEIPASNDLVHIEAVEILYPEVKKELGNIKDQEIGSSKVYPLSEGKCLRVTKITDVIFDCKKENK